MEKVTVKDLINHLKQFDQEIPVMRMNNVGRGTYLEFSDIFLNDVVYIGKNTFKEVSENGIPSLIL